MGAVVHGEDAAIWKDCGGFPLSKQPADQELFIAKTDIKMHIRDFREGLSWTEVSVGLERGGFYKALQDLDQQVLKQSLAGSPYRAELAAVFGCELVDSANARKAALLCAHLAVWLE